MRRAFFASLCVFLVVFSASAALGKKRHVLKYAPLPQKLVTARTVFLDNQTGFANVGDKAYQELEKWGRFRVVDSPKKADVVFLISQREYEGGYTTSHFGQTHGAISGGGNVALYSGGSTRTRTIERVQVHLTVVDPRNGVSLWADSRQQSVPSTIDQIVTQGLTRSLINGLRKRIKEQAQAQR